MSKTKFIRLVDNFCAETITGIVLALYRSPTAIPTCDHRLEAIIKSRYIDVFLMKYINDCWRDYHHRSDQFVVNKIDAMKDCGICNHISCIFQLIFTQCTEMRQALKLMNLTDFKDADRIREQLINTLDLASDHNREDRIETLERCSDADCEIYDFVEGEDFVI